MRRGKITNIFTLVLDIGLYISNIHITNNSNLHNILIQNEKNVFAKIQL